MFWGTGLNGFMRLSVCLSPAHIRMKCSIEIRSYREFQVTSGFQSKHSEAERASLRTNPIVIFTKHFRLQRGAILSENDDFVASRITSSCQLMANCSLLHQSVYALHCDSCECTLPDGCRSANATSSNRQRNASCETESLADCTSSGRMAVLAQHHLRGHRLRRRKTHTHTILMNIKPKKIIRVTGASRQYQHNSENCVARQRQSMRHTPLKHTIPIFLGHTFIHPSSSRVRSHSAAFHSYSGDSKAGKIYESLSLKHC